jgi:RimJ/RimL family protein N-acetyltransferase
MITRPESPVYLRAIDEGDLEPVHRWHNDAALYASLVGTSVPTSLATELAWLQRVSAWSEQARNFALCAHEDDRLIGLCYLRDIDWTHRRTELHILIGDDRDRGRGFGRGAVDLLIDHAFDTLGLARVYLHVLAGNAAARRLYAACGFLEEGRLRGHAFKNGRWEDVLVMGVLRDERTPVERPA